MKRNSIQFEESINKTISLLEEAQTVFEAGVTALEKTEDTPEYTWGKIMGRLESITVLLEEEIW